MLLRINSHVYTVGRTFGWDQCNTPIHESRLQGLVSFPRKMIDNNKKKNGLYYVLRLPNGILLTLLPEEKPFHYRVLTIQLQSFDILPKQTIRSQIKEYKADDASDKLNF